VGLGDPPHRDGAPRRGRSHPPSSPPIPGVAALGGPPVVGGIKRRIFRRAPTHLRSFQYNVQKDKIPGPLSQFKG